MEAMVHWVDFYIILFLEPKTSVGGPVIQSKVITGHLTMMIPIYLTSN